MSKEKVLVTGGAGFIGSHVVKELIKKGFDEIIVIDNLSKGRKEAVLAPAKLEVIDLLDKEKLTEVFKKHKPDVVLHFAAAKLADESVIEPEKYYQQNIIGGLNLLSAMIETGTKKIIFSSTAAVYGDVKDVPITEESATLPINPYGWTKLMFEQILKDYHAAYGINFVSLRYFNAAGADIDGELGNACTKREDVVSVLMEVASGKRAKFVINGGDYNTSDGTPVRDLIHVNDLATAHVLALEYLERNKEPQIVNLGSENGFTVKDAAEITKEITGATFAIEVGPRRPGDIVISIASSSRAKEILGWQAKYSDLKTIIQTAWNWEQKNKG